MEVPELFNYLIQSGQTSELFVQKEVEALDNLKEDLLLRTVENSIFPSMHEDWLFFKEVWPEIKADYLRWAFSQTKDGLRFTKLMQEEISFLNFSSTIKHASFLRDLRKTLYTYCHRLFQTATEQTHTTDYNFDYSLLHRYYADRKVALYTTTFQSVTPANFIEACSNYYSNLGYEIMDGVVVNGRSLFVLASRGELELTTETFNLGLLPWTLKDSIKLQGTTEPKELSVYGWTEAQLLDALSELELTAAAGYSKAQLVSRYRFEKGTDGYIDWQQVKKYHMLSKDDLRDILSQNFSMQRDQTEELGYNDLISNLESQSDIALELESRGRKAFLETQGYIKGIFYKGAAYVLRAGAENITKSFWYPNLSGEISLMYNGIIIPRQVIAITYETFLWACERKDEISAGFFVMIAQKLGLWKLIKQDVATLDAATICLEIGAMLQEISKMN